MCKREKDNDAKRTVQFYNDSNPSVQSDKSIAAPQCWSPGRASRSVSREDRVSMGHEARLSSHDDTRTSEIAANHKLYNDNEKQEKELFVARSVTPHTGTHIRFVPSEDTKFIQS